jgi:hypothetical protein
MPDRRAVTAAALSSGAEGVERMVRVNASSDGRTLSCPNLIRSEQSSNAHWRGPVSCFHEGYRSIS